MKNRMNQKLEEITVGTLIVGVDVAKSVQWARFVDYRGVEIGKAISFKNNRQGFENIVARIVSAAAFLGEVGNPLRFQNARQIVNYAGYNLVEDSSGQNKSGTCISKRGRKQLRSVLYQMAFTMVSNNGEMISLYRYLTTRRVNPLKKKQALVVISKKIITVIYSLLKKQAVYDPTLVLGAAMKERMMAA